MARHNCKWCGKFMKIDWDKTFEGLDTVIYKCDDCDYEEEDGGRMDKLWDWIDKQNGIK